MKVTICSCARCTAHGNEFLYDSANIVKTDIEYAYELEGLGYAPEIEIVYENIMDEIENPSKNAPLVKIDDTYIKKAKPEVMMEMMFDELKPKK
ncbi:MULTISPECIES: hypothetical protein [Anaerococcus]|uniref:hypothetical protein n=1 Tax=Anaerococcus TaxID=165779 RepID=UPI0027B9B9A5|nr:MULTISPECIES: hypothetical protein [Anaerococcus]MDU2558185.1 hypothetical protein [Anaerococcus prevotii]